MAYAQDLHLQRTASCNDFSLGDALSAMPLRAPLLRATSPDQTVPALNPLTASPILVRNSLSKNLDRIEHLCYITLASVVFRRKVFNNRIPEIGGTLKQTTFLDRFFDKKLSAVCLSIQHPDPEILPLTLSPCSPRFVFFCFFMKQSTCLS